MADTGAAAANDDGVHVCCRFRPVNKKEQKKKDDGSKTVVTFPTEDSISFLQETFTDLKLNDKNSRFSFDHVFPPGTEQSTVFERIGSTVVDEIIQGFNSTIFAYGQTGSGKTHTMMGVPTDEKLAGLIPRVVDQIFGRLAEKVEEANATQINTELGNGSIEEKSRNILTCTVTVSYVEIYMEKIKDLLDPSKSNLRLREKKGKGVWIQDVTSVYVSSGDEVYDLIELGSNHRAIASTEMNATSSRSHSVFILRVNQTWGDEEGGSTGGGENKSATLYLVDLAGSEKVRKTKAKGQTLKEATQINKSLSALGNVIKALTASAKHVPYRNSKLTRLLQDALGGNCKTFLMLTASPAKYNMEETLSTLRFGQRAKRVKNKPIVNAKKSVDHYMRLLKEAELKIMQQEQIILALEQELSTSRPGTGGGIPSRTSSGSFVGTIFEPNASVVNVADIPSNPLVESKAHMEAQDTDASTTATKPVSAPESEAKVEKSAEASNGTKQEKLKRSSSKRKQIARLLKGLHARIAVLEQENLRLDNKNAEVEDLFVTLESELAEKAERLDEQTVRLKAVEFKYVQAQRNLQSIERSVAAIYDARLACAAAAHHREAKQLRKEIHALKARVERSRELVKGFEAETGVKVNVMSRKRNRGIRSFFSNLLLTPEDQMQARQQQRLRERLRRQQHRHQHQTEPAPTINHGDGQATKKKKPPPPSRQRAIVSGTRCYVAHEAGVNVRVKPALKAELRGVLPAGAHVVCKMAAELNDPDNQVHHLWIQHDLGWSCARMGTYWLILPSPFGNSNNASDNEQEGQGRKLEVTFDGPSEPPPPPPTEKTNEIENKAREEQNAKELEIEFIPSADEGIEIDDDNLASPRSYNELDVSYEDDDEDDSSNALTSEGKTEGSNVNGTVEETNDPEDEKKVDNLKREVKTLRQHLRLRCAQHIEDRDEIDELKRRLTELKAKEDELHELRSLRNDHEKLQDEMEMMKEQDSDKNKLLDSLRETNAMAKSQLAEQLQKIESLTSQLEAYQRVAASAASTPRGSMRFRFARPIASNQSRSARSSSFNMEKSPNLGFLQVHAGRRRVQIDESKSDIRATSVPPKIVFSEG